MIHNHIRKLCYNLNVDIGKQIYKRSIINTFWELEGKIFKESKKCAIKKLTERSPEKKNWNLNNKRTKSNSRTKKSKWKEKNSLTGYISRWEIIENGLSKFDDR